MLINLDSVNIYRFLPIDHYQNKELLEKIGSQKDKLYKDATDIIHYKDCSFLEKEVIEETLTWMKSCKFKTLNAKKDRLDKFVDKIKKECEIVDEEINPCNLSVLGIDTETTSLNTKFKLEGGELLQNVDLVDVVIATSEKKGYLIPFNHNETDGVKNYDEDELREFLQRLVDEFYLVYFNANYDMSILTQFGVEVNKATYSDVALIGDALGLDTVQDLHNKHNLKFYSKYFLGREMLTIEELMGAKFIALNRLSAKTTGVYSIADAVNTISLFHHFTKELDNPYIDQSDTLNLDHRTLYHHIGMFNHGLPLNQIDEILEPNLRTVIHRMGLVEKAYYELPESLDFKISAPERVNYYIGKTVIEALGYTLDLDLFLEGHKDSDRVDNYLRRIAEDFGVILKVDENKSRGRYVKAETRKIGTKGVEVLNLSKKAVTENQYWKKILKKRDRGLVIDICNIVENYRVLQLELTRLGKMYRYARADDRGFATADGGLRYNGTDCVIKGTKIRIRVDFVCEVDINIEDLEKWLEKYPDLEIDTPDGWQKVEETFVKPERPCKKIFCENGLQLGGSYKHYVQKANLSFISLDEVKVGDVLITKRGDSKVVKVEDIGDEKVYDLTVKHKNHRYYANGISSHNTRRYSNASGDGDHRFIIGAKQVSLYFGNGGAGINFQGLPSTLYAPFKAPKGKRDPIRVKIEDKKIRRWLKMVKEKTKTKLLDLLVTKFNHKK